MKILLAEDSKAMRLLVMRALTGAALPDLAFVEAEDGFEAFRLVAEESPDLVLADWNMADVNGLDLLRALRGAGNPVPFGFLTAESSATCRAQAEAAGAQFLLGKPFTAEALVAAVRPYAGA